MNSQAEPSCKPRLSKNTKRLIVLCVLAGLFNSAMLFLTIADVLLGRQGFLLLVVWLVGRPALLLQLAVLVPLVLCHLLWNRSKRTAAPRTTLVIVLCAALALGAAPHAWFLYNDLQDAEAAKGRSEFYASGLYEAVESRNVERAATILRAKGPNLLESAYYNNTPLILATKNGDSAMVAMLLSHGADPDRTDAWNRTALSWGAEAGHLDIAGLLLQHGADVNKSDDDKMTPLAHARAARQTEMAALLQSKGGATTDVRVQVFEAIRSGRTDELRNLIEAGFDVNWKDLSGTGLLHEAAGKGNPEMVDYLLNKGADLNANCYFGTPLHSAASEGRVDMIRLLVAKGAKVDAASGSGMTAMDYAKQGDHQEAMKVLRELGATR